eukprot:13766938-Ditylum_brightwellii.AAC.1
MTYHKRRKTCIPTQDIENQNSVALTGFDNIKHHVPDPEVLLAEEDDECMEDVNPLTVPIHVWILRKRSPDGSKQGCIIFAPQRKRSPK